MLVQPTQDEGASSERLSDEQPSPSHAPTSEVPYEPHTDSSSAQPSEVPYEPHTDSSSAQPSEVPFEQQPDPSPRPSPRPSPNPSPTPIVPDSIPEPTGENLGDHSSNDTSLLGNEDDMTLQNVYDLSKPVIKHHKAYLKTVSLKQRFPRKSFSKKHRVHKESVSKQGRKKAKGESSVQRDPLFDVMPEDKIDHMETENAQSEGRTREMVDEDKEFDEDKLSTEDVVSTVKERVSTDFEKVSTDRSRVSTDLEKVSTDSQIVSTDGSKVSTDEQVEGTEEIFEGTEEQREGTEEKVESTAGQMKDQTKEEIATKASQTSTQTPTSMIFGDDETIATLLLNMSQDKVLLRKEKVYKGKKKIEEEDGDESESEDDDIPQAVKKFKQLKSDEEMARKIQEEWAVDRIHAEKLQEKKESQFTIEERAKFLHDTKLMIRTDPQRMNKKDSPKEKSLLAGIYRRSQVEVKEKRIQEREARREEVSFEKGSTDANAKSYKLESEEESTMAVGIDTIYKNKVVIA
ncbi:hypothetical protein Tco_0291762 [Tanacetum coccineum]